MSSATDATAKMVSKFVRVLFVHDAAVDFSQHFEALQREFIVRVATNLAEVVDVTRSLPLACVVCACSGSIRAREVFGSVERVAPEQAPRFVFLHTAGTTEADLAFLASGKKTWLPLPVPPDELLALVRATSSQ